MKRAALAKAMLPETKQFHQYQKSSSGQIEVSLSYLLVAIPWLSISNIKDCWLRLCIRKVKRIIDITQS
jgi:hypothetical protein